MSNVVKLIKIMEIKFVAKISDSDFYDKLKNNEISFTHGDIFYVDLNVTRVFNSLRAASTSH